MSQLLKAVIASFDRHDDLSGYRLAPELVVDTDEYGLSTWMPLKWSGHSNDLVRFYELLGLSDSTLRYPPLFEEMLLSYRWEEVELLNIRFLANLPGDGLELFASLITGDEIIWKTLIQNNLLIIGHLPDTYDPVCIDFNTNKREKGIPLVSVDHETILCKSKIGKRNFLYNSFDEFAMDLIM